MRFLFLGLIIILLTLSCDSFVEGYEVSPTKPIDIQIENSLSSAEAFTVYVQSDILARLTSTIVQQVTFADRSNLVFGQYNILGEDLNDLWGENAYAGALKDLRNILEEAQRKSHPTYSGIAKVLIAFNLGLLTDVFGDIPYSEGLSDLNLNPKYDSQKEIYSEIFQLLDKAVNDLRKDDIISSSDNDFIYHGNKEQWLKFAIALKIRYLNHLSNLEEYNPNEILSLLKIGFQSNLDDAEIIFYDVRSQSNPWAQFLDQRQGYIQLDGYMFDLMRRNNDPRIDLYGEDGFYMKATSPITLITYTEIKFIESEVLYKEGRIDEAKNALFDAVNANMQKIGVTQTQIDDYKATLNLSLQTILEEKYVALYSHPEAWTDWRRTGYPILKPNTNSVLPEGELPRRLPYPESEERLNRNVPKLTFEESLLKKMWWDVN
ncbi:SusD/RagB family nutrient-binding outer membrane lipoprotein [Sediminitomix flava]|uniref:SusD/RagB-like outer membrane lipoprotein n=1 Tax=Sediminitomix flava TaxID=379075 RepID=A0A315ZHD6_SEDFL|nr:SusD/RagB family nutrient-binding outer membrane lipoprotein [Sediminitomix flava]PWJ45025.1 SusD/RagB-like outer membrane lipoprotein [Sediminitomix flava]